MSRDERPGRFCNLERLNPKRRFPARPPEPGFSLFTECEYCDPDGLGTTDTHRAWLRKRDVAELVDYVALIGAAS